MRYGIFQALKDMYSYINAQIEFPQIISAETVSMSFSVIYNTGFQPKQVL